ncbi:MAG TPA: RnfH family protein [Halothiobacillaceae bacterium]|nr:RnfH family protein [Halothiobacillaceae bacterium]
MLVEVAYARPDVQVILSVDVPPETTAIEAVKASGILTRFPEIDLEKQKLGIFGKVVPKDKVLAEFDRVEIYRPLIADPKTARRKRAAKAKKVAASEKAHDSQA